MRKRVVRGGLLACVISLFNVYIGAMILPKNKPVSFLLASIDGCAALSENRMGRLLTQQDVTGPCKGQIERFLLFTSSHEVSLLHILICYALSYASEKDPLWISSLSRRFDDIHKTVTVRLSMNSLEYWRQVLKFHRDRILNDLYDMLIVTSLKYGWQEKGSDKDDIVLFKKEPFEGEARLIQSLACVLGMSEGIRCFKHWSDVLLNEDDDGFDEPLVSDAKGSFYIAVNRKFLEQFPRRFKIYFA